VGVDYCELKKFIMKYRTLHGNTVDTTPTTNTKKAALFLAIDFHKFECLYKSISILKSNGSVGCFVVCSDSITYEHYVSAGDLGDICEVLDKNNVDYKVEFTDEIFFENWEIIVK
jgi:hypothetical protein